MTPRATFRAHEVPRCPVMWGNSSTGERLVCNAQLVGGRILPGSIAHVRQASTVTDADDLPGYMVRCPECREKLAVLFERMRQVA